jgi:magnesium chelatase subunit I
MVDLPLARPKIESQWNNRHRTSATEGVKAFEPGLLARANRGILYVDEVNLLDDHLVDVY